MTDPRLEALVAPATPPFSFTCDGVSSRTLVVHWKRDDGETTAGGGKRSRTVSWRDHETGLVLRWETATYDRYPVVEWVLHFENRSTEPSPRLSDILALDATFAPSRAAAQCVLRTFKGSEYAADDYAPRPVALDAGSRTLLQCVGGRGSNGTFPFFNLDWGSEGVACAIGWPGQWGCEVACDDSPGVRVRAGMATVDASTPGDTIDDCGLTSLRLGPGESIRTPLVALLLWDQPDWHGAQNVWRRWMLDHNVPRVEGKLPEPILSLGSTGGFFDGMLDNAGAQREWIDAYVRHGLTAGSGGAAGWWWMDAGWYEAKQAWPDVGTWRPDSARYPDGLRPVTDRAREAGMRSILWYEPERVAPGTWLDETHPEWILGPAGRRGSRILDLGNPDAWAWLVEYLDSSMREQGIDLYRQDFNIDPLPMWNAADAPGQRGLAQIRYVTAYLALWDELRRRNPSLQIDTCASGGRRNDLETLRRAIPLHRSDYTVEPTGSQGIVYGLSFWAPYHGLVVRWKERDATDLERDWGVDRIYVGRSSFGGACLRLNVDVRIASEEDFEALAQIQRESAQLTRYQLGDYWPLTDYSVSPDDWIAWQNDRPDLGEGVIQAFRRQGAPNDSIRVRLRGLDQGAEYELCELGGPAHGAWKVSGRELSSEGLQLHLAARPGSVILRYRRAGSGRAGSEGS